MSSAAGTDSEGLSGTDSVKERTGRGIVYGREAVELYLQCLQSVLMREVWWAINQQGVMRELEGVVRGMWGQRLRMCEAWTMRELREDVNDAERRSFSSLGSGTEDRELVAEGRLPDLRDTLCLVYFGMVLLRLPVMVRDVLDWSRDDGFGFANTRTKLPWDAYRRLPLSLRNRFNVQVTSLLMLTSDSEHYILSLCVLTQSSQSTGLQAISTIVHWSFHVCFYTHHLLTSLQ